MNGWARSRRNGWHTRSRHAQVEASTRWSLIAMPWIMLVAGLSPIPARAADTTTATVLAWVLLGTSAVLCTTSSVVVRWALAAHLGERGAPWGAMAVLAAQTALAAGLTTALVVTDGLPGQPAEGMSLMVAVGALLMPYALLVRARVTAWTLAGLIAVVLATFGAAGMDGGELLVVALVMGLGGLAMAFSARCSGWYIAVMRELDEAREAQSRLAVAEERLRFGRDLHDVLGRNLSVIALKSELAVQLARRGGEPGAGVAAAVDAAVNQMVEVQRIARDSQREVREVVRGYRAVDLGTELAGARGVLRAASIDCRTDGDGGPRLPEPVRAALGWVVREGTTNVLRHADATRCAISVRTSARSEGRVAVLTMENDGAARAAAADGGGAGGADGGGAGGASGGGGAGLAGLRERLGVLDGTLSADRPAPTTFRLTAEVPLDGAPDGSGHRPGRPEDASADGAGSPDGSGVPDARGDAATATPATAAGGDRGGPAATAARPHAADPAGPGRVDAAGAGRTAGAAPYAADPPTGTGTGVSVRKGAR